MSRRSSRGLRYAHIYSMHLLPIQPLEQCAELCRRQLHHAIGNRRPLEGGFLKPLPNQHKPRSVPQQDLHPLGPFGTEYQNRATKWILSELFLCQRGQAIGTTSKINRPHRNQNAHPGRDRDHIDSRIARSTELRKPKSIPERARTTAPATSISITSAPKPLFSADFSTRSSATLIGTKLIASSPGRTNSPFFAACRHANNCWGRSPCRRA